MRPPPPRIILIEDNADDEILLMRQLQKADLHTQVMVFHNGGQALAYLMAKEQSWDEIFAIFLDLKLPTLSGLKLLKAVRALKRTRRLPVVIVTCSQNPRELSECHALGISAWIDKPVTFSTFTKAIANIFNPAQSIPPTIPA